MTTVTAMKVTYEKLKEQQFLMLCVKFALVFFALSITHYAGFIAGFPIWVISAAAVDMFPAFSKLSVFYIAFCYSISRVLGFVTSQFIISISTIASGTGKKENKFSWLKKYVVDYKGRSEEESAYYWVLTIFSTVGMVFLTYVTPSDFAFSTVPVLAMVVLVVAALLKMDVMVVRVSKIPIKILRRPKYRANLVPRMGFVLLGFALCLSYYTGLLRFERLMKEPPIEYKSGDFTASLVVLISSGDSVLGIEETEDFVYWTYSSGDTVMKRSYRKKSSPKPSSDSSVEQGSKAG
ncbi:hypothetical protein SAMN05216588_12284 [Pseudomonas flavescens]|uniref:Uncharacterized protein n=1 Tax=Phytopseudomonas flavescens TaxID=29435 RepID=A0A1G8MT19_9GAMM|nr:hypothetical protein [Pseudomonas flavescens]SDI71003.1 hypothetical protein SAMN05216588_12284 [Pseudomonas flavescens]